ncbi:hypothetical protein NP511_06855 [Natrinema thermotolerans]|uniref:DUF8147 domain-containing protein n=1 Tax=Natrinema thermotolerans TaxID=121872 RepID=A0AAF0PDT0_9EURY|nr:hypothetical protein [Natrinema thermotolerans]ELZ11396.1 hypothetical protein C478_13335 [Natrinema thermotolerans DSM 11552]QCC58237.1 hypothetical protein DVR14_06130 [Natrinema thermotolerans]WMT09351.1 hypothetical protein NP511_06855 [Natrinema thermotolerans]
MRVRTLGYAAAAGLATFLVVFVAVSELLLPYLEFSVLVGLPAGIGAGVLIAAVVLVQFGRNADGTPQPLALGLGTFGVTFLTVLVVALVLLRAGVIGSIVSATGIGIVGGLVVGIRARREKPPTG